MGGLTSTDYLLKLNESYWVILEFAQSRKMKVLKSSSCSLLFVANNNSKQKYQIQRMILRCLDVMSISL